MQNAMLVVQFGQNRAALWVAGDDRLAIGFVAVKFVVDQGIPPSQDYRRCPTTSGLAKDRGCACRARDRERGRIYHLHRNEDGSAFQDLTIILAVFSAFDDGVAGAFRIAINDGGPIRQLRRDFPRTMYSKRSQS
jgi:hypothetical protein